MSNLMAARFANAIVMVSGDKAEWLSQSLPAISAGLTQIDARLQAEPMMSEDGFWPPEDHWLSYYRPYKVVDGTLMIPVKGMLLHDFPYALGGWATGYEYLVRAFLRGVNDGSVQRIAMIIDSPGGEVAGCFDNADKVYALRGQKPIQAFVNESAYSAAYAWATVADKITMTRTAGVGSVGVVTAHMDVSAAMEKAGYKITFIHAGDHKVDGNPYQALPEAVKARIQQRIDSMYTIFTSTTSRNLSIEESVVIGTQALCYGAEEALAIGFAHEISPFDEALAAFSGELDQPAEEESDMELTAEQEQAVAARIATAVTAAKAEGMKEGASAEKTRISGILASDAAKTRPAMAQHLALNTAQSVEEANGILAISQEEKPAASAEKPNSDFAAAMKENNPDLHTEQTDKNANAAAEEEALFLQATGFGDKAK